MADIVWVFAVNMVIWSGLIAWLWRLHRSVNRLENDRLEKKS